MKNYFFIIIGIILSTIPLFACSCSTDTNSTNVITSTEVVPKPGDEVISIQASYPQLTLDDLVKDSDLIIIGKVIEILPAKIDTIERPGQKIIYTDVIVQVEKALYGQAEKIAIRVHGGTVEGITMINANSPIFRLGEEVCLLLRHPSKDLVPPTGFNPSDYYKVVSDYLGKGTYQDGIMTRDAGDSITIDQIEFSIKSIKE